MHVPGCIEWLNTVKDTTVRPTDIWICGYPKSGTTWLSEIVSLIMDDGVVDRVRDRLISDRVPNIIISINSIRNYKWFEEIPDPRITINHLPLKYLPRFEGKEGKELIADSAAMIATIARFLGKQFTAETVANITTHCSLKTMRDNPAANKSDLITRFGKPGQQFLRSGIIGDWRAHMTDTQSALFDQRFGQPLRAMGLRVCDDGLTAERCVRENGHNCIGIRVTTCSLLQKIVLQLNFVSPVL
ncbi:unnamed protein product [Medioppia subpectinata]|uniref:Sulfotransferase domain-containing protein n=1 Tax=Medioppia subpectinata TaxID=1979941 RepID=A0A7R9Q2L8_9ACAR|nr:unnamed protein product [Medioppia subpectinata]CAG2110325.1 unnamed protein product [Medioppia subpectinata]